MNIRKLMYYNLFSWDKKYKILKTWSSNVDITKIPVNLSIEFLCFGIKSRESLNGVGNIKATINSTLHGPKHTGTGGSSCKTNIQVTSVIIFTKLNFSNQLELKYEMKRFSVNYNATFTQVPWFVLSPPVIYHHCATKCILNIIMFSLTWMHQDHCLQVLRWTHHQSLRWLLHIRSQGPAFGEDVWLPKDQCSRLQHSWSNPPTIMTVLETEFYWYINCREELISELNI